MARLSYRVHLNQQRSEVVELEDHAPVSRLIEAMIRQFGLPPPDPHASYVLYDADKERLSDALSLNAQGVAPGSVLYLVQGLPWWLERPASPRPPTPRSSASSGVPDFLFGRIGAFVRPIPALAILTVVAMVALLVWSLSGSANPPRGNGGGQNSTANSAQQSAPTQTLAPMRSPTATLRPETPTPIVPTATLRPAVSTLTVSRFGQRQVQGVQPEYAPINPSFFLRDGSIFGAHLFLDDQLRERARATRGWVLLSNGDQVEVLQNLGNLLQIRIVTNQLDPDDQKVIGAIGYVASWVVTNQNVPPIPTATPRPTREPPRLRVRKINENDSATCFSMQIRGINVSGWTMRVDGFNLIGVFDGGGNARICGLGPYQEVTYTVYDGAGRAVPGGRGIPTRGSAIMLGDWR